MPAAKRRRLSPPEEDSAGRTNGTTNAFYQRAADWDLEQDYENRPRKLNKKQKEATRLPIKTAEGRVEQLAAQPTQGEGEDDADSFLDSGEDDGEEWGGAEGGEEQDEDKEEEEDETPKISPRLQIINAKEELAKLAGQVNEDPEENYGLLHAIAGIGAKKNVTVRKLVLATQLTVYKDIIPGYRIRPLSGDDMGAKLSKDVRKLRNFEQSLVAGYQNYVNHLATLSKGTGSGSKKGISAEDARSLSTVAISCACNLLLAVPHFNFRSELLKILVDKLSQRTVDADFVKCRETLEKLFEDDDDGTPSLDAVSLLTKMIKGKNYRFDPSVLNTFLHLRLLSEFASKGSTDKIDKPGDGDDAPSKAEQKALAKANKKSNREFRTKRQRKIDRERKAIENEMKEADATVSHEERDRMQAETLKLVFVTYFRILKARTPSLMGAVLEGLAKYAHLINQDFFGDLLEALKDLIGHAENDAAGYDNDNDGEDSGDDGEDDNEYSTSFSTRNTSRESLLCVITAFALLQGQDASKSAAALHLDLNFFITHLYRSLYPLALNADIELGPKSLRLPDPNNPNDHPLTQSTSHNKINLHTTTVLLLRSLSAVLLPPQGLRAVPPLRIAAFTKQLYTSALQLPEKSALAVLGVLAKVMKVHGRKVSALWYTEERKGDGTFDPLRGEVEGSNPFATTIWEGELLRRHYCPAVRESVEGVEKGVVASR
ncbi:nucleolar complex-associated protein 3 [Xylona heveae TC161]|uniref:Nucleolar complex-associated protein 3 n=1 Tax=Xylona heveae (strain CBS 132557 / TC161) TaxID=1328760 RepID=A0A165FZR4_XYLHT|nr:nucleolar complex-associated protein 3 [Xylona heveae TC161]KZF21574.1 nucleolar complex-associated protein 3 [Xylona heveae TC161]